MKISALLFVVTITAVTMVFVPSADGLKCYICRGTVDYAAELAKNPSSGSSEDNPSVINYRKKVNASGKCENFNTDTQKQASSQAECPSAWVTGDPFDLRCFAHKTLGRGCWHSDSGHSAIQYKYNITNRILPRTADPNERPTMCFRTDFCNGFNDSNGNMNGSTRLGVVVTLLGVSYLVRGYFGSGAGF